MDKKKISLINDKFDIQILLHILKKNIWFVIILFFFSTLSSYIYLRYTPQLYKSVSIIQISKNNSSTEEVLGIKSVYSNYGMSQVIELMRSKEFLKRTFNKLPLKISYFSEGTFLSSELYKSAPFEITYQVLNENIYNKKIFINFIDPKSFSLSYEIDNKNFEHTYLIDKTCKLEDVELNVIINDYNVILQQQQNFKSNSYYFILNNPDELISNYSSKIEIILLNDAAQTIQINFNDNNPKKTSDIVNAIAEEFLKYEVEKKTESADNIIKFLDQQILIVTNEISDDEKNIMLFNKENNINSNSNNEKVNYSQLIPSKISEYESLINKIDIDLLAYKRFVSKISEDKEINVIELFALIPEISTNSTIVGVYNSIQSLINEKEELLNDVTNKNRQIILIEKQIEKQRNTLLKFIEISKNRLEEEKIGYIKKIAEYEKRTIGDSDYNTLELAKLKRFYSIHQSYYGSLIDKKAQYMISQAGYVAENVILEKSITPVNPISPIKVRIFIAFFVISFTIILFLIVIKYLLYNKIVGASEIKTYTDLPLIGVVPNYKLNIPTSQLLINKDLKSTFSESFRTIRSNLDFIGFDSNSKIITITSTISGEGKTFVAINLAGIIAISGKKVILIDFDLRKPRLHLSFNTDNSKGMSTILIHKTTIEDCIKKTDIDTLDFITAGPVPPNPSELIMHENFDFVIENLKKIYDVIIIDTSPIGIVTDAMELLSIADCPIYITKANYSRRTFFYNANHLANEKDISKLSLILNGVSVNKSNYYSYGYGFTYGYGNKYGYGHGKDYGHGYYTDSLLESKGSFINSLFKKKKKRKR